MTEDLDIYICLKYQIFFEKYFRMNGTQNLNELLSVVVDLMLKEWQLSKCLGRSSEGLEDTPIQIPVTNPRNMRTPIFEMLLNLDRLSSGYQPIMFGDRPFCLPIEEEDESKTITDYE